MTERNRQKRHKTQVNWSQPGSSIWQLLYLYIPTTENKALNRIEKLQRHPKLGTFPENEKN